MGQFVSPPPSPHYQCSGHLCKKGAVDLGSTMSQLAAPSIDSPVDPSVSSRSPRKRRISVSSRQQTTHTYLETSGELFTQLVENTKITSTRISHSDQLSLPNRSTTTLQSWVPRSNTCACVFLDSVRAIGSNSWCFSSSFGVVWRAAVTPLDEVGSWAPQSTVVRLAWPISPTRVRFSRPERCGLDSFYVLPSISNTVTFRSRGWRIGISCFAELCIAHPSRSV